MDNLKSQLSKSIIPAQHTRHRRCWSRDGQVILNVHRLEELVCVDLPKLTKNRALEAGGRQFIGLADRCESTTTTTTHDRDNSGHNTSSTTAFTNAELEQVAQYLMEIVSRPKRVHQIPHTVLSELYSFCGIIYDMNHEYTLAEQAHLRALWVARKLTDTNTEQVQASRQQLKELSRSRAPRRRGTNEKT